MKILRRLIVGVDFAPEGDALSRGSERALSTALCLATHDEARVDLVYAAASERYVESLDGAFVVVHEGMPPGGDALLEAALQRFVDADIVAQIRVLDEQPLSGLIHEALDRQADMIVVGKHDKEEEPPVLGGVATKLLRKSPVPVWVVGPTPVRVPHRILAATDLGPTGDRAVAEAALLTREFHAELAVVHAFQLPMDEELARGQEDSGAIARHTGEIRAKLEATLAANDVEGARLLIGCTAPVRGILNAVESFGPDLLVLGTLGRAGLPGLLIGNTAEKVLPRVPCSILAIKPEGFVSPVPPRPASRAAPEPGLVSPQPVQ